MLEASGHGHTNQPVPTVGGSLSVHARCVTSRASASYFGVVRPLPKAVQEACSDDQNGEQSANDYNVGTISTNEVLFCVVIG